MAGAAGSGKKNSKQQQVKREQPQKEVARAPPADNEPIVAEEEEEKSDKKMDEVAVAASITYGVFLSLENWTFSAKNWQKAAYFDGKLRVLAWKMNIFSLKLPNKIQFWQSTARSV